MTKPVLVLCVIATTLPSPPAAQWRAGLAAVKITPEAPVAMAGYASRTKPSDGVVADLYAKVLALEDGNGQRAVWMTTDLIGLRASVAEPMLQRIMARTGLKRHQLLVNSSHTHTGPAIAESDASAYSIKDEATERTRAYARMLQDRIVGAVEQALARMEPAELSYGSGVVPFVMNRREFTDRGVILGVNPRGPADRSMPLLKVSAPDGKLRAVVFGAATHNTTLTGDTYSITGDYAGFAQEYVQAQRPGVQAMFVLGCAGDANPYPRGTLALARQHGETLGREVLRVLETKLTPVRGPLNLQFDHADLPLAEVPARPEIEKMAQPPSASWRRWTASRMLEMLDRGETLPAYYRAPIALWQFGTDLTLVALSGEAVVDYAYAIERALGPLQLWIAAYNNDVFGYLPSARVLAEGGYETRGVVHGGIGFFSPKAQDVVVAKVREMAQKAGRSTGTAVPHEELRKALTFHAAFDGGTEAALAAGDPKLYWAPSVKQRQDATPGLPDSGEVQRAIGAGRFGDALRFTMKKSPVVFFRGADNMPYSTATWSGTVSFWLNVDPQGELEPGFCDPVQITPRAWNDAAFFVEFEKRPESIPFRLGVYADVNVWNPEKRRFADIPAHERPLVTVDRPPFGRGKWTHVLFTFERFNTGTPDGVARLYLDGKPHGALSPRRQTFTWDPAQVAIALGLSYIGLLDELSIFDRALSEDEIRTLYTLPKGVTSLLR